MGNVFQDFNITIFSDFQIVIISLTSWNFSLFPQWPGFAAIEFASMLLQSF